MILDRGSMNWVPKYLLCLALAGASLLYLRAVAPAKFGFYHDDAIYVVGARALASGDGYRIMSLPYEPPQTKYPPFYPIVLSAVWRLKPEFPDNLPYLMSASTVFMLASLALTWRYWVVHGYASPWMALTVVTIALFNLRTVILATNTLSEPLYAALSTGTLWLAESEERKGGRLHVLLLLAVLLGCAFLTRIAGITLAVAVVLWYLLRGKRAGALVLSMVVALFVLSWFGWCYRASAEVGHPSAAYYTSYVRDWNDILSVSTSSPWTKLGSLLLTTAKNAFMLVVVTIPLMCLGLSYSWLQRLGDTLFAPGLAVILVTFLLVARGFVREAGKSQPRLLFIYALLYVAPHLLWPYTAYDRFLMPLLPVLLLCLWSEMRHLMEYAKRSLLSGASAGSKGSAAFFVFLIGAITSVAAANYVAGVYGEVSSSRSVFQRQWAADFEIYRWIRRNTESGDILVCYPDPLYYLYTGRKALGSFFWLREGELTPASISTALRESGAKYLIHLPYDSRVDFRPDISRTLIRKIIESYPGEFVRVEGSPSGAVYRIAPQGRVSYR